MLRTFCSLAEVSQPGEGEAYQWLSLKISLERNIFILRKVYIRNVTSSCISYFIDNFSLTSSTQVLQYRNKILYRPVWLKISKH